MFLLGRKRAEGINIPDWWEAVFRPKPLEPVILGRKGTEVEIYGSTDRILSHESALGCFW